MKLAITSVFTFLSLTIFSQLKVDAAGRVGIGTLYPSPGYQCHIKKSLLLSSDSGSPFYELQFKIGNGLPGVDIGSTGDKIAFWTSYTGFNQIGIECIYTFSDSTAKRDIVPISNATESLMKLKTYSYFLNDSQDISKTSPRRTYGFLSQEVKKALPEVKITDELKGSLLMDYNQIIPIVTKTTQEQQFLLDSLLIKVNKLEQVIDNLNVSQTDDFSQAVIKNKLFQNAPNPFKEKTEIKYKIDKKNFIDGKILIFKMDGTLVKELEVSIQRSSTVLNGSELDPGMYIYALVINKTEVDSKRMIIIN